MSDTSDAAPPIAVRGAREHNLRDVDLDLAWGRWVAVTGPSGSGKTSLVFDTLVRESQRRYLGGLSARARQFFGKLGRAPLRDLTGIPASLAVGVGTTASARSTVGTRIGALDLLRLLYARVGTDPGGEALTRSHFSFNVSPGACEACGGSGLEDRVDPALLIADASKSIRDGALVPTLKNGYTVYSQVTLEVMDTICRAHGFDVHTPWSDLTDEQRHVILYGTKALKVPFGKHSIESRMRWEGITARPREEGYYRGLVPVIEQTLARDRNPNILRFVRSQPCSVCGGTRLSRVGRETTVGPFTLPSLLDRPVVDLVAALDELPDSAVWRALEPSLRTRLDRMQTLSLGHLSLARPTPSLSGGEAQRLQIAAQLGTRLGGMMVALDEPTLGLHPEAQDGLRETLDGLLAQGNTVVVVEHDPDMVRHADDVLALGPGAGKDGGRLVPVSDAAHPLGTAPTSRVRTRVARGTMTLRGASLHNLQATDLIIELGCFNVVMGPSGAGKSSLVFGTLLPALTGEPGGAYEALDGAAQAAVSAVDARPIGRTPRSTPATWTGLFDHVRKAFAATPAAKQAKLGASAFSYNTKRGRCPACEGLGIERVGLHLLEDVERPCSVCSGQRYAPDILAVTLRGKSIGDVLAMSVDEAVEFFAPDPVAHAMCRAMQTLGLGYLPLGHGSHQLSRGEAQRVKLAALLGQPNAAPTLLLLDEPDRGLHPQDIERLITALDALVDAGHTIVAISHHRHVWAAADVRIEVRDGVATHDVGIEVRDGVATHDVGIDDAPRSTRRATRAPTPPPPAIELRGVTTHGLKSVDVTIPHRTVTAVAGVSGSGKSSLVFDTLAAEAWHRFAESLPFTVRQLARRQSRPAFASATGLTPVLSLQQNAARATRRSTVATQSEVGPLLRLLWSRAGTPSGFTAEHFSRDRPLGACEACAGMATVARCSPSALLTDATRPLAAGAFAGTKPGAFFTLPDDQHVATLKAALRASGVSDDLDGAWNDLPDAVCHIALQGAGDLEVSVSWSYARGARTGTHTFEGPWLGLCGLVEREAKRRAKRKDAAAWQAPLVDAPCPACDGTGLRPEVTAVTLGSLRLPDLLAHPADAVLALLDDAASDHPVYAALRPELAERLEAVVDLGLGHLALDRRSPTLSAGELQRLRLAAVLRSGLAHTTVVLDEPTAGLHADDVEPLLQRLRVLRDAGNTVIVVSHRPAMLRGADHLVELGPGGGPEGGTVLAAGPTSEVLAGDGPTARALRTSAPDRPPRALEFSVRVHSAGANNLKSIDIELPSAGLVALTGPSGSGKSTLLFDVLEASARAGQPVGCAAAEGLDRFVDIRSSRGPQGRTVLTALGAQAALQTLFAKASDGALPKAAFSFDSPKGRCEVCKGTGVERVALDALADVTVPCPRCGGARFKPEVLAVRWNDQSIADVLSAPAQALVPQVSGVLAKACTALLDVGLGHLALGRDRATLSGGESQRLTLAARLLDKIAPSLVLLDEPGSGQHELDLLRLRNVFGTLVDRGDLIVIAEHRTTLIDACDWIIDLGPGGGPAGGKVIRAGRPQ